MTSFAATLCDGRAAERWPVTVDVDGDEVRISGEFAPIVAPRSAFTPDDPVTGMPRILRIASGGTLETDAKAAVEELWPTRGVIARAAFALESRWSTALGALAVIVGCTWFIVTVALPKLAEPVANSLSPEAEEAIGTHTLATLDRAFLKRSSLPPSRRRCACCGWAWGRRSPSECAHTRRPWPRCA